MAKPKPLMTPEQQKLFKQAVAAQAIPPIKYEEYCKITPEEAEKMLLAVADKFDSGMKKTPEREAPTIKEPNAPATRFQKRAISEAVKAGHMEKLPEDRWAALTKDEASRIIGEIYAKQPPAPATESQMQEIEKLVKDGRIFPMKTETWNSLSKDKASTLIGIGRMNQENGVHVEGYDPNYIARRDQPKTAEQVDEIKRLVQENRLNPVPFPRWKNMTQEEAGRLIYVGRMREAAGESAPERERSREQEAKAEPEKTTEKKHAPSRSDDMPM